LLVEVWIWLSGYEWSASAVTLYGSLSEACFHDRFRAFRHVFRNIYRFQLDADRVLELLRDLHKTVSALDSDLDQFVLEIDRAMR
jgi:hypothetical protein